MPMSSRLHKSNKNDLGRGVGSARWATGLARLISQTIKRGELPSKGASPRYEESLTESHTPAAELKSTPECCFGELLST